MKPRRLLIAVAIVAVIGGLPSPAGAGAIVLANRVPNKVAYSLILPDGRQIEQALDCDDVAAMPVGREITLAFKDGGESHRHLLRANGIYVFHATGEKIELRREKLPGQPALSEARREPIPRIEPQGLVCTIPVAILVDDKEPRVRRLWEKHYRDRVAAASAIFERCCRVRFEAVVVDRWTSPDRVRGFLEVLAEFERTAPPPPTRLAIGFTGHFENLRGDIHMGGTRGPFRPHILIREWGHGVTEPERLEMLVHELGHYLGAAHSAEPQSVMRPDLSDRQSRAKGFHIRFDAPNALAVCLVAQEIHNRPLTSLSQVSPVAKEQLRPIYRWVATTLPNDPAAPHYLVMLRGR